MSFEIQKGSKSRSTSRSAKYLLLTGALCGLTCAQTEAAPLAVHKPVGIGITMRTVPHIQHRSIWATRWAAAHPAQEAQYVAKLINERHFAKYYYSSHTKKLAEKLVKPQASAHLTPSVKVATKASVQPNGPKVADKSAEVPATTPVVDVPESVASSPAIAPTVSDDITAKSIVVKIPSVVVAPRREAIIRSAARQASTSGSEQQRRAAYNQEKAAGDVTLDFVAADINDVIKALAVQTGANIVSSTDVKGTITVSLSHVSLDEALDMIARLSGYQYAKIGSTYVIGTASGLASFTGAGSDQTPVSAVVNFDYASYSNLSNTLAARFPDLKIADGSTVAGSKDGAQYKAILLTGDAGTVAQARDLITQIDSSLGANVAQQSTDVYRVEYASAPDLISILGTLVPNLVVTPGPHQGFSAKAPSAAAAASSSGASGASTSGGGGGAAPGATGASQSAATGPDLLLLTGTQVDIARAQQILGEVDVQPAQIDFETKVTEVDVNKVNNLGLNWNFCGATTRIGERADNIANPPATLGDNGQTNLLSFGAIGRTAISDLATITMDALLSNGTAKLLADPNISAIDGHPAQVFIGNTVNYVESITQTTTGQNITTGSVQVGVILRVTGKVGSDGYITLNVHPEVSEITSYLTVPGGGSLPEVSSRYADTTIRVKNGETIAIGGLIQENDTKNVNKVPGLGNLPFIGKLFQDSQDNKQRTEVVFLLTTKIAS
jgi:type II secretory pathway component GspD/PulD (secretin)